MLKCHICNANIKIGDTVQIIHNAVVESEIDFNNFAQKNQIRCKKCFIRV